MGVTGLVTAVGRGGIGKSRGCGTWITGRSSTGWMRRDRRTCQLSPISTDISGHAALNSNHTERTDPVGATRGE